MFPPTSASVQEGNSLTFSATAFNAANATIAATFTYQSSNTDVLNIAPNGTACAGKWDAQFIQCIPGPSGVAEVVASTLGASSAGTLVFVHPPIDNIQIRFVPPVNSPAPACPGPQVIPAACSVPFNPVPNTCLSPNQNWTLQATAFSKGVDITGVVGPFTWSEGRSGVVKVTPISTSSDNVATNRATVASGTPGVTQVYATAAGVRSVPYYAESCPVQCVALDLGVGLAQSDQTSFSIQKGQSQVVTATAVDVQGCVVPKAPLTWSSSQPTSFSSGNGCTSGACALTALGPGAASITASCSPPACNAGWPLNFAGLNPPLPDPQPIPTTPVYPVAAISGLVRGVPVTTGVLATSRDCSANFNCSVGLYAISTSSNLAGNPNTFPEPPNSILFDGFGDRAYAGSEFGAILITPSNLSSASASAFSIFTTARGQVLAVSENGSSAVFSDTLAKPNQVYIVTGASSGGANVVPLNISGGIAAAFSPDGLKTFIIGCSAGPGQCPNGGDTLYIYSPLQALQSKTLSAPASAVAFSSSGAFAFVDLSGGVTGGIAAYNTCDNSLAATIPLPLSTTPSLLKVLPDGIHLMILDTTAAQDTGLEYVTTTAMAATPNMGCPQVISGTSQPIPLGQGNLDPINFFVSPDGTTVYVVARNLSRILAYNFTTNSVAGIPLANNVTPISADISSDGTLIYVGDSAGVLHQISTVSASDMQQISFTTPARFSDPFCSLKPASQSSCSLDLVAVKP